MVFGWRKFNDLMRPNLKVRKTNILCCEFYILDLFGYLCEIYILFNINNNKPSI